MTAHDPSDMPDAPEPEAARIARAAQTDDGPECLVPQGSHEVGADLPDIEPMTASLLGRFFAVPFLIIGTIIGGAVLVVLLFGGPATTQERSVGELLQILEANSGERSLGILLPREKELWQTALELGVALKGKAGKLPEEDLESVAQRISTMVRVGMTDLDRLPTVGAERSNQRQLRSRRLEFLIHALGRTQRPAAVETLIEVVRGGREPYVQAAMQELGDLHTLAQTRDAVEPIVSLLSRPTTPETRMVACTTLSVLAEPGDPRVLDVLGTVRRLEDGEVAWSAALALARLGSSAGVSTLLDLLDRKFLEAGDRYQVTDQAGTVHRYPISPARVDAILIAAIDSVSNLPDAVLWEQIEALQSDPSAPVRTRAGEALARRGAAEARTLPFSKD